MAGPAVVTKAVNNSDPSTSLIAATCKKASLHLLPWFGLDLNKFFLLHVCTAYPTRHHTGLAAQHHPTAYRLPLARAYPACLPFTTAPAWRHAYLHIPHTRTLQRADGRCGGDQPRQFRFIHSRHASLFPSTHIRVVRLGCVCSCIIRHTSTLAWSPLPHVCLRS